ncbi:MAG: cold shock domain-containing protein [candidate division KSB1 bacterium]|nr:cold shock domain-containing protein [candidate division KSB1 bacterium]MDZ7342729.1 cold shock domain-containing protein [candidate division KSB1 bacterium]
MQYGYVKKWDATKGFGFIVTEDDEELFVHVNDLDVTVKEKRLREGQKVAFDVRREFKGDKAIRVRIVR